MTIRDQAEKLRQMIVSLGQGNQEPGVKAKIHILEGFYQGSYETLRLRIENNLMVLATPKRNNRIIFVAEGTPVRIEDPEYHQFESSVQHRNFEGIPSLFIPIPAVVKDSEEKGILLNTRKRVAIVASGKGGVGKTTFSVNVSLALTQLGYRVTLLDADLGLANVDVMLGINPRYNLSHVLRGEKKIRDIMHQEYGLNIVAGGSGIPELFMLDDNDIAVCVEALAELETMTDILIIDSGAGISPQLLSFVDAADDVIVVCTPEPTSLTDAYALIKVCSSSTRKDIICVVNRAKDETDAKSTFRKLAITADRFLGIKLRLLGWIPDDPTVTKAIREQRPVVAQFPKSPAARSIRQLADKWINSSAVSSTAQAKSGIKAFFARLLR